MLPSLKKNNGKMVFRKWDRTQPLCLGKFGIPEPNSNNISLEPDILIVPLLAFDKNKNRLGYGGGYFDRALEGIESVSNKPLIVGMGYDYQIVNDEFGMSHDIKYDIVITETRVLSFN